MEEHGVRSDKTLCIDLVDQYKMPIDDENVDIITQFKNCSHFFIEMLMDYQHTDILILIEVSDYSLRLCLFFTVDLSFQSLENYLLLNNGNSILTEQKKLNRLSPKNERKLLKLLVEFTIDRYSMYPTETQTIIVCKAALEIFAGFKGGFVSFCIVKSLTFVSIYSE